MITLYKYAYYENRNSTGIAVTRSVVGGVASAPVDLSNYYTKEQIRTSGGSQVHFDNVIEAYHNNLLDLQGGLDTSSADSSGRDAEYYHLDYDSYLAVAGITFAQSIEKDSLNVVKLVNDEDAPGNDQYYGTDSGGNKGYWALPTGSGDSLWEDSSSGFITPAGSENIGIEVDDLFIKDRIIYTASGHDQDLTIQAGSANGDSGNDAGDLILKAGDAQSGNNDSLYGSVYLTPGNPYDSGLSSNIYLGGPSYSSGSITLSANGSSSAINLMIYPKGSGLLYLGLSISQSTQVSGNLLPSRDINFGGQRDAIIKGAQGGSSAGYALTLVGGTGYGNDADYNGGDVRVYGGDPKGVGVRGNIYFGTGSAGYLPEVDSSDTIYVVTYNPDTGKLGYTQLI